MRVLLHLLKIDYAYQINKPAQYYADGANEVAYINWLASTKPEYIQEVEAFEKSVGFKILADNVRTGKIKPEKPVITSLDLKKIVDQFTIWC